MIRARAITVTLGGSPILRDVDVSTEPGAFVGLIGPNGAGKTTLLRAIHGTVPAAGSVTLHGITDPPRAHRARLAALVPQQPVTPRDMRVFDYVLLGRSPYIPYLGVESSADVDVAREALHWLEMQRFADRRLGELSGGELQQVVLARAIAQRAPILLLDEPTSALDIGHQQQVLDLIDRMRADHQLTVLAAFHDLTLAAQYCDRLVLLADGEVVADGDPRDVLREDVISRYYGARVRVLDNGMGLAVVPIRQVASGPEEGTDD